MKCDSWTEVRQTNARTDKYEGRNDYVGIVVDCVDTTMIVLSLEMINTGRRNDFKSSGSNSCKL